MARRNRAKKHQLVNPDDLAPGVAKGLTQGIPAEEVLRDIHPAKPVRSLNERIGHMRDTAKVNRVPAPRFVAEPNDAIITDETGRRMLDVDITMRPETVSAIKAGYICLRCLEPQASSFPEFCDLCGYAMAERQIMDAAMELQGEKHLGPAKPISEYIQEQEEEVLKRQFNAKIAAGASPMRGLR